MSSAFVTAKNLKSLSCTSSFPYVCGPSANCVDEDLIWKSTKISYCECKPNTYGEPPNCRPKCMVESCNHDEYCRHIEGDCVKGCTNDKSCKVNEFCDPHERVCKISCIGDQYCKSDEYCDFQKSTCIKGCRDDDSCKKHEYCDRINDRVCKVGCREWPGNCIKGQYCNSKYHHCEKGCEFDRNCESNQICNLSEKSCYSFCFKSPCGNNSVCAIVNNQQHCSCKSGYSPVKGVGCKLKSENDTISVSEGTPDCQKYCGHKSMCVIENNEIVCYCLQNNAKNPFIDCSFLPPPQLPPAIGPGCIAVLCG